MKILVVNADDFGYSRGINRGIIKAHEKGIVASTSVMVTEPAAQEAKVLKDYKDLSVGLHFNITGESVRKRILQKVKLIFEDIKTVEEEFKRQIDLFIGLVGRPPDHLDSHHHVHLHPKIKPIFEQYSREHQTPVRAFGEVNFVDEFFGWDRFSRPDLSRISVKHLLRILSDLPGGVSELMCHPGFVDPGLKSSYAKEREVELATLVDDRVAEFIVNSGIKLCNWREASLYLWNS